MNTRRTGLADGVACAALGWSQGSQYVVQARHAAGRVERLPALAQELAALQPAVIAAWLSEAMRVAARVPPPTTPIVWGSGDAPFTGLEASLARPGGMVPGMSSSTDELCERTIELLVESMPRLQRVGFLAEAAWRGRDGHAARARRPACFFDRILIGTKPGDLAIEQPTAFYRVINLKTAKAQGIEFSPAMLARATEVIE